MDERMDLKIDGMGCGHCVASVREALEAVPGVEVDEVEIGSARVRFADPTSADRERVLEAVRRAGYEPAG